ncbi:MAG TPA: NAD(P)/FAD-dependent oxidoreductase [Thermodesulfobacteriota bacterium]|nr:NAD(P)/FAD-dependent oxidoreductase [Thermodesulfobacteriota bacterium]
MFDAIIVGGGPAGLSAALILGRCRRHVLLCDAGNPRNAASHGLHGYLTRDGIKPADFLRIGREELQRYDSVEIRDVEVSEARRNNGGFEVILSNGTHQFSRKLLLATGVTDRIPEIEGIETFYGRSVFHCPYCDGWGVRDQPIAVYGRGKHGLGLSLTLKTWSDRVILCTDGPMRLRRSDLKLLSRNGIDVRSERAVRLEGTDGVLERIVFENGEVIECRALFLGMGIDQHSILAEKLGCEINKDGGVRTYKLERTSVPGLYVAGDTSRDVLFAIVAAAEGAKAALAINKELQHEQWR